VLVKFWKLVQPAGPGWKPIRELAGHRSDEVADRDNIPLAMIGWVAGCTAIWSALFAEGSFLYGRYPQALLLAAIFLVSSIVLARIVSRTWTNR